jgi:hypothetical protein
VAVQEVLQHQHVGNFAGQLFWQVEAVLISSEWWWLLPDSGWWHHGIVVVVVGWWMVGQYRRRTGKAVGAIREMPEGDIDGALCVS